MTLHQRTVPVQAAYADMRRALNDLWESRGIDAAAMLLLAAEAIRDLTFTNLDITVPRPPGSDADVQAVTDIVDTIRQQALTGPDGTDLGPPTTIELILMLIAWQDRLATYALRDERNPRNPDKKADEQ